MTVDSTVRSSSLHDGGARDSALRLSGGCSFVMSVHEPLSLLVLRANPRATRFYEREGLRVVAGEETKPLMRSSSH
jgi:hypothetical protein